MKNISIFLAPVLFTLTLAGCNPKTDNANEEKVEIENKEIPADERAEKALYDEVMAVHDKAMPLMDGLMKLKGQLQEKLDLLREQDGSEEDIEKLEAEISNLESADKGMMEWMRNFEPQDENPDHEAVMKYYEEQKEVMTAVYKNMKESMARAEELLR